MSGIPYLTQTEDIILDTMKQGEKSLWHEYSGPPKLYDAYRTRESIFSGHDMPGGRSDADRLDALFGIGNWAVDSSQYALGNGLVASRTVGREAFSRYCDIIVYPDGDNYASSGPTA